MPLLFGGVGVKGGKEEFVSKGRQDGMRSWQISIRSRRCGFATVGQVRRRTRRTRARE